MGTESQRGLSEWAGAEGERGSGGREGRGSCMKLLQWGGERQTCEALCQCHFSACKGAILSYDLAEEMKDGKKGAMRNERRHRQRVEQKSSGFTTKGDNDKI